MSGLLHRLVLWNASESRALFWSRADAENVCGRYGYDVFPLYAVRLTDAEREALVAIRRTVMYQPHADAIDGLLERSRR